MADFQINGVAYQSRIMNGETHAFVLKRMLPMFTAMVGVVERLPEIAGVLRSAIEAPGGAVADEGADETSHARMARVMMPIALEVAALRDEDVRFIFDACMDVTQRQIGNTGWAGVRQKGAIQHQADDTFMHRLLIAWNVLGENFGEVLASMGMDLGTLKKVPALG